MTEDTPLLSNCPEGSDHDPGPLEPLYFRVTRRAMTDEERAAVDLLLAKLAVDLLGEVDLVPDLDN